MYFSSTTFSAKSLRMFHLKAYNKCQYRNTIGESITECTSLLAKITINNTSCNVRHYHRGNTNRNHYDVLQITPSATQSQVKKAYYKMSLLHHPDQHKGNADSAEKFRTITEAYEVLSNVQKRKLYDKGFLQIRTSRLSRDSDAYSNVMQDTKAKERQTPATGRSAIYDFDAWHKAHYADKLHAHQAMKQRRRENMALQSNDQLAQVMSFFLIFLCAMLGISSLVKVREHAGLDTPIPVTKKKT